MEARSAAVTVDPGEQAPADTSNGTTLALTWLGHATALIELDGKRLLTDPLLGAVRPLTRIAPPVQPAATEQIDAVLLSHLHADHAHTRSLRRIARATPIIAPAGAGRWLKARGLSNVEELAHGEWTHVGEVCVWLTPARHVPSRGRAAGVRPSGFVICGSRCCYFAGDTDLFAAMATLAGLIDLALLPVGGWGPTLGPGHLDPVRAARAAAAIRPRAAVPIHYGTLALPRVLRRRDDPRMPALLFAELVGRRAPEVDVHLLDPGARLELRGPGCRENQGAHGA